MHASSQFREPRTEITESIRISLANLQTGYLMFRNQRVITRLHSNIIQRLSIIFTGVNVCLGYRQTITGVNFQVPSF